MTAIKKLLNHDLCSALFNHAGKLPNHLLLSEYRQHTTDESFTTLLEWFQKIRYCKNTQQMSTAARLCSAG